MKQKDIERYNFQTLEEFRQWMNDAQAVVLLCIGETPACKSPAAHVVVSHSIQGREKTLALLKQVVKLIEAGLAETVEHPPRPEGN